MDEKPILLSNKRYPEWLYLCVPIPSIGLYQIYMTNLNWERDNGCPQEWAPMEAFPRLYDKITAIQKIQKIQEAERVDRLTALVVYGIVVEE